MRFCDQCGKPMHSSNHSEWYRGDNYDVHAKCVESWKEDEVQDKGVKDE